MDNEHERAERALQALATAQQLTVAQADLAEVMTLHAGHHRQATLLRDGVAVVDEPCTIFAPLRSAGEHDATSQRA